MAQNYAQNVLGTIDERFTIDSITKPIINNSIRLDYNGANSCTIYNVDVVTESNYVRTGANRFGALVELGTGTQTFVLSQDKAFTFTVDRGNLEDSKMAQEVDKAVKRQVREVSVPTTDIYRLNVAATYAAANNAKTVAVVTNTNAYKSLLDAQVKVTERKVPKMGRYIYMTETFYALLKRDPEFIRDCDTSYRDLKSGIVGQVDGATIVTAPSSYFVANFAFMVIHKDTLVAPTKFNMIRTLDEVQGIDGWVAEGRRYYDCFIPKNKGAGIQIHTTA